MNHQLEMSFYTVLDPEAPIPAFPAISTFYYKVCDQNPEKFDETMRLIRLFMEKAYELGTKQQGEE